MACAACVQCVVIGDFVVKGISTIIGDCVVKDISTIPIVGEVGGSHRRPSSIWGSKRWYS